MNRDIKFRVWLIKEGKMAYPTNPLQLAGRDGAVHCWLEQDLSKHKNPDYSGDTRCSIMQFTGLKDKNGNEIYEGDFVRIYNNQFVLCGGKAESEVYYLTKWEDIGFRFIVVNAVYMIGAVFLRKRKIKYEVIGNIFQNPELLTSRTKRYVKRPRRIARD